MSYAQSPKQRELHDLQATLGMAATTHDERLRKRLVEEGLTTCARQIADFQEAIAARSFKSPHDIIDRDRHLFLAGFLLLKGETEDAKEIIGRYLDLQGPTSRLHPNWVAVADHLGLGAQMEEKCNADEIAWCRDRAPIDCMRKLIRAIAPAAPVVLEAPMAPVAPVRPQSGMPQHGYIRPTNG